jgi:hypothetical protein
VRGALDQPGEGAGPRQGRGVARWELDRAGVHARGHEPLELLGARRAVAISAAGWARFYPRPGVRSLPVAGLSPSEVALAWRRGESNPLVRRFVDLALATARAHPSLLRAIERPVPCPPAALARRRPA